LFEVTNSNKITIVVTKIYKNIQKYDVTFLRNSKIVWTNATSM